MQETQIDLVINKLTKAQYNSIEPSDTELYFITDDSGLSSSDITSALGYTPYNSNNPSGYQANILETVKVNGTALTPSSKTVNITVPTNTTQLVNGSGYITGISSSDVTTALGYTPYSNANPSGYQANVIETVQVNGTALTPSSKAVDITVPTSTTQLTNDSGFITGSDVSSTYSATGTAPINGTAVASAISGKADSSTTLAGYGITDAYTKTQVDGLISSVYKPAGSVAFTALPSLTANVLGNVYNVTDAFTTDSNFVEGSGKNYPANTNVAVVDISSTSTPSYKFDVLSGFVDLSGYQQTDTAVTHTKNTAVGSSIVPVYVSSSGVATTCIAIPTSTTQLTNDSGYITSISSANVTTALGYTPAATYTTTNPSLTASSSICTWNITHNLGDNVEIHVYNNTTKKEVLASITLTSSTAAKIELLSTSNLAAGAFKAVAIGK